MTKTITLPFHDVDGTLSPLVLEAMAAGATSANNPADPDTFFLTFPKAADAKAFEAKLKPGSDPVDDQGEASE